MPQAVISVRDRGEGVPAAEQHRVFERFHRVEGGLTRTTGGTGLGLYIAREVCEANGATLDYVETAGGAQFTVQCWAG